jgi:hypothetical protein
MNTTYELGYSSFDTDPNYTMMLGIDLEAPINVKNGPYGNAFSGYFKAPSTAMYRFYLACDDACMMFISNGTDPTKKQVIFNNPNYVTYRDYFRADGSRMTAWINLT